MIVVTAMPVVNAKARTITTKIVFMTRVLSSLRRMPEPARHSVTGITEQLFARSRRGALSVCIHYHSCFILGSVLRLIEAKIRRSHIHAQAR
jgi:hypothetical protein